jgi:hypothetical protein
LETAVPDDMPIGAHLATPRRGFVHHGLYAGGGRVIHYAGGALRRGPVEEVSLERFARGRGVAVKPWVAPKYAGEDAVARARSRLGEDRYRVRSNNCEHFVHWCLSGIARSPQIEGWMPARLRNGLAALGSVLGARGIAARQ